MVDHDAAFKGFFESHQRFFGHANVDLVNVAAKNGLAHTVQEIGNAQSGHQQGGAFLIDQMTQHQILNDPRHDEHDGCSQCKGNQVGRHRTGDACIRRNPFSKTRHGQGCKQHHRALRKVEHTRGFVNEHEAQGHQGIEHAGHQTANQGFKKKSHFAVLVLSVKCPNRH